jgi:hypothetical protein
MSLTRPTLSALALLGASLALPALAASSAASSASEATSSAASSASNSVEGSSKSSSGGNKQVAQGDYRVVALREATDRPGMVRVELQTLADGSEQGFTLVLPRAAVANGQLAEGGVVSALARDYGWEFTSAATAQTFFLVIADAQYQELQTRVVKI